MDSARAAGTLTAKAWSGFPSPAAILRASTVRNVKARSTARLRPDSHCPEGWTLYQFPGPQFEGLNEPGAVQSSYQTWVDQFDTFGLGENVPFATGNLSDSLEGLVHGKFVTLRVPYPMGFHAKGLDGRIDDPNGGWKAKGLWSTYAGRAPYHIEGGKGTTSKVVKFQLRPDPLAH